MNTVILDTIARHLDSLPLSQSHRAEVFHAWEIAPDAPLDFTAEGAYDAYLAGPANRAWQRVKAFRMFNPEGTTHYATTLDEMNFYASAPTKANILEALARASFALNGVHA